MAPLSGAVARRVREIRALSSNTVLDMALAQDERRSMRFYSMSARFMDVLEEYYIALERAGRRS
jgi:hypothetical protein